MWNGVGQWDRRASSFSSESRDSALGVKRALSFAQKALSRLNNQPPAPSFFFSYGNPLGALARRLISSPIDGTSQLSFRRATLRLMSSRVRGQKKSPSVASPRAGQPTELATCGTVCDLQDKQQGTEPDRRSHRRRATSGRGWGRESVVDRSWSRAVGADRSPGSSKTHLELARRGA